MAECDYDELLNIFEELWRRANLEDKFKFIRRFDRLTGGINEPGRGLLNLRKTYLGKLEEIEKESKT